jgi:hypothetical protein
VAQLETQQQVKRLREDTEIELQDLRGRWLATEGLLTTQRNLLKKLNDTHATASNGQTAKLAALELALGALAAQLEQLRRQAGLPLAGDDEQDRLARSYEEIYCLRKRGAEESVAAVYKRYGFNDAASWSKAWEKAAASETFERAVSDRVKRLCP